MLEVPGPSENVYSEKVKSTCVPSASASAYVPSASASAYVPSACSEKAKSAYVPRENDLTIIVNSLKDSNYKEVESVCLDPVRLVFYCINVKKIILSI